MISSVAPALLSAATIAVNKLRHVIGLLPAGADDRRFHFQEAVS
jgi:hypothetical protein